MFKAFFLLGQRPGGGLFLCGLCAGTALKGFVLFSQRSFFPVADFFLPRSTELGFPLERFRVDMPLRSYVLSTRYVLVLHFTPDSHRVTRSVLFAAS